MRRSNIIYSLALLVTLSIFMACSKDDDTGSSKDPLSGKLKKIWLNEGSDTASYNFSYDDNGKMVTMDFISTGEGYNASISFIRNDDGKIITCLIREGENYSTLYNYNIAPDGKFESAIATYEENNKIVKDDYKFNYTGNRIAKIEIYRSSVLIDENSYTYDDRGNIIERKYYGTDGHGFVTHDYKVVSTYDTRTNPFEFIESPAIIGNSFFYAVNNVLTETTVDDYDSYTTTYSYNYNEDGKPKTAIIYGETGSGFTYNFVYY